MNKLPRSKIAESTRPEEHRFENEFQRNLFDLLNKYKEQRVTVDELIDLICSRRTADQVGRSKPSERFQFGFFSFRKLSSNKFGLGSVDSTSITSIFVS